MQEMSCDLLVELMDVTLISFVYFGSKESLEVGGSMSHLAKVSTTDSFNYPEQPILFYYNTDPECKEYYKLKADEPSIVMYTNKANILEGSKEDLSTHRLLKWINQKIAFSKLEWNRRTFGSVTQAHYNALIYLDSDIKSAQTKWVERYFGLIANQMNDQGKEDLAVFLAPYHDSSLPADLPQLSSLIGVGEDQGAGIWFWHGNAQKAVKYDLPLEEIKMDEELLMLWASQLTKQMQMVLFFDLGNELLANPNHDKRKLKYYRDNHAKLSAFLHQIEFDLEEKQRALGLLPPKAPAQAPHDEL